MWASIPLKLTVQDGELWRRSWGQGNNVTVGLGSYAVMSGLSKGALWEGRCIANMSVRFLLLFFFQHSHKHPGILATLFRNSTVMGTGDVMTTRVMTGEDSTFLCHFSFFFFFKSPTQWNHEQCGHAKAYSTVMLWGNSQESSMPSCQSRLERNINRSIDATVVTFFFLFSKHSKSHSFGSLFFSP